MNPIKAIILEDEKESLQSLCYLLEKYCPGIHIVGTASSLKEGRNLIENESFKLGFFDIDFPDGRIFDLIEDITPVAFHIIFITGYDEYAVKAFKYSAIDYLLKPVSIRELKHAVERTREVIEKDMLAKKVNVLIENLHSNKGFDKIALPTSDGMSFAKVEEIVWCRADGNYTVIYLSGKQKRIVSKTLKEFEDLLSEEGFLRVHNSHLININHVSRYVKGKGGIAIMSNGDEVEIAVRKKKEFLDNLNWAG